MKKIILLLPFLSWLIFSCTDNSEKEKANQMKLQQVKTDIDSAIFKSNALWDTVIQADNNKMKSIKRLLDEISYTDTFDEKALNNLYALHDKVLAVRYTQQNLSGELIDYYDQLQDSLITATNELFENTKGIENHPLAIELIDEIMTADGRVVIQRGSYDVEVKKLNEIIKNNSEDIKTLGEPYSNINKYGIFGYE